MRAFEDRPGRPLKRETSMLGKMGRNGQVPFLLAEQRRGWSLMIFCARATRRGSSVWLAGLSGLSCSSG